MLSKHRIPAEILWTRKQDVRLFGWPVANNDDDDDGEDEEEEEEFDRTGVKVCVNDVYNFMTPLSRIEPFNRVNKT